MATIDQETAPAVEAPPGSVLLVADQDINATIRVHGGSFEIVRDRRNGIAWPAGTPFPVPENLADEFLDNFGPRPGVASLSSSGAALGRIVGLRRA